jgi:hypothetical protein
LVRVGLRTAPELGPFIPQQRTAPHDESSSSINGRRLNSADLRLSADKSADSTRPPTGLSWSREALTENGIAMRSSNWTPSIVPGRDQDACLVIDDLGKLGLIYCESDVETASAENVIEDLLDG